MSDCHTLTEMMPTGTIKSDNVHRNRLLKQWFLVYTLCNEKPRKGSGRMNEMLIFWLVLLIVAIVAEVLTMGLTTIWFAGGALIAILAAVLHAPIWLQIVLFFLVSLLLLAFTRPVAVKYFNKDRVRTNVESMVGRQAVVTGEIDNIQGIGQVTLSGQEWSARSTDDRVRIPVGSVVDVVSVSGVKLIVKVDEQMQRLKQEGEKEPVPEPLSVSQMEELENK